MLLFCGSKKSLVSGVPMAGALFPAAQVGQIVLPLMLFHQLQLFVCAGLAGYLARQAGSSDADDATPPTTLPRDADEAAARATALGLSIPAECMPGVTANLALLSDHAETFLGPVEDRAL